MMCGPVLDVVESHGRRGGNFPCGTWKKGLLRYHERSLEDIYDIRAGTYMRGVNRVLMRLDGKNNRPKD